MSQTIFYDADYVSAEYAFDTTRKSSVIAQRLITNKSVSLKSPQEFKKQTRALVNYVHDPMYVSAVDSGTPLELASAQGFTWDKNIYKMAIAHNAGVVAAVDHVINSDDQVAGTLSSGLHHAKRHSGEGFCTFNGLAVAATHAFELGLDRVLVLDFDAHCGGGTRSMCDPEKVIQVDVSTSWYDTWSPRNEQDLLIDADSNDYAYLSDIRKALAHATNLGAFDLIIYNAGMDPANSGVSPKALRQREQMVADWVAETETKAIYTLAGGYTGFDIDMEDLADLHCLTIDAFS